MKLTCHGRVAPAARAPALALAFALLLAAGGQGCNWLTGGTPRALRQGVLITCNQPKAMLTVDERLVGAVGPDPGLRLGLAPGPHRVTVRLAGYYARYYDVRVSADRFERLRVSLRPELD